MTSARPSDTFRPIHKIILTLHMFGHGGTDRVCAHLANGFANAGFETEIVTFCAGGRAEEVLKEIMGNDVRVTSLDRTTGSRPLDLLSSLRPFVRHLRRERPDCVLSTGNNMNWVTAIGLRLAGLQSRLVFKTTNPIIRPTDGPVARLFRSAGYARAFAAADAVWTLSDAETAQLCAAFPTVADRFRTVVNPYVTPAMLAVPDRAMELSGRRHVIAVGRLAAQKRLDLLVHAFAKVQAPDAHLTLLGEGDERAALEALVEKLALQKRVSMPGFVPNISEWMHLAELLVLPSAYEGLPAVVLEAMAANCRVLATDCFPSARQLVGTTDGCAIIERPDSDLLAKMIDRSLAQPRPTHLTSIASKYAIANGIKSHVAALSDLVGVTTASRSLGTDALKERSSPVG